MNYIRHLTGFFTKAVDEERLSPTHISMYMALFQFWNLSRFKNPVSITRSEVMRVSKINAVATYHKCIKDLDALGFILYTPSYNPFKGSLVTMLECRSQTTSKIEQQIDSYRSFTSSNFDQLSEPSINSINITNNKTDSVVTRPDIFDDEVDKNHNPEKEKSCAKKEKPFRTGENIPPPLAELHLYFSEKEVPEAEAEKFRNHYEANGWLVGGKSPMKNWQAAARNWILNTKKFNGNSGLPSAPKSNHLQATTQKSYQEKL